MRKQKTKLEPDEEFCLDAYLLNGDAATAYKLSHHTDAKETSIAVMSQRWITSPSVKKYLQTRKALTAPPDNEQIRDYTDKNILLQELSRLVVSTHNVKERNELLKTIADVTMMKKDQSDNEKQLIHFFLPLTCKRCNLYCAEQERRRKDEMKD
jgi:uncharacterized protein YfaS (alpha-2-macroglobulin family)